MSVESSKKYAMIPFDMLNSVATSAALSVPPPNYQNLLVRPELKRLSNLDLELKSLLDNISIPSDIKYKKYSELLNKYSVAMGNIFQKPVAHIEQENKRVDEPALRRSGEASTSTQVQTERYDSLENVIRETNIQNRRGNTHKDNAKILLSRLDENPDIRWDKTTGEIFYKDEKIPGSNIVETISDFMRVRKNIHPGFEEVKAELEKEGFPRNYIVNKEKLSSFKEQQHETPMFKRSPYINARSNLYKTPRTENQRFFTPNSGENSSTKRRFERTFTRSSPMNNFTEQSNW